MAREGFPIYSTSDADSALLDHDLHSFRFYDTDGSEVPEDLCHRIAAAFEDVLTKAWAAAGVAASGEDASLGGVMEAAMAGAVAEDIPLDGSTVESRVWMWLMSSWEVRPHTAL